MLEDAKQNLIEGGEKVAEIAADKLIDSFLEALGIPEVCLVKNALNISEFSYFN